MNSKSVFVTNGDAGHTNRERVEHDYYATHPSALEALLKREQFSHFIWEPACGGGHLSEVLIRHGHAVMSTDIVDRGFAEFDGVLDFMSVNKSNVDCDIITNPPYTIVTEWTRKALSVIAPGHKLAMFLKLTFLETQKRYELFMESPPRRVYVFSSRQRCGRNGVFEKGDNAVAYAWFVWEKGFTGDPVIKWIMEAVND